MPARIGPCRRAELPQLNELANRVFRARRPGNMANEYPLLFAEENVEQLRRQHAEMEKELADEVAQLEARFEPEKLELTPVVATPRKSDINVQSVCLAWLPFQVDSAGVADPMW